MFSFKSEITSLKDYDNLGSKESTLYLLSCKAILLTKVLETIVNLSHPKTFSSHNFLNRYSTSRHSGKWIRSREDCKFPFEKAVLMFSSTKVVKENFQVNIDFSCHFCTNLNTSK